MFSPATAVIFATYFANFVLYTAYDKVEKTLKLEKLLDVLLVRKSVDHTLVELNKVHALSGISLMAVAFLPLPVFATNKDSLLQSAFYIQVFHSVYSLYKYYGDDGRIPKILSFRSTFSDLSNSKRKVNAVGMKKVSNIFGLAALVSFYYLVMSGGTTKLNVCFLLLTSALHFYTMEIDYKWNLNVRPYGLLPFLLIPISLALVVYY